jgi:hypothetical protein
MGERTTSGDREKRVIPLDLGFGTQVENRVIHKRGVLSSPAAKDGKQTRSNGP